MGIVNNSIVNNPWIIGIGAGILSGLVVTIVSRTLLSKRENKEYRQKVFSANREIIYSIRPGISENIVPTTDIIKSLITSTSRKYSVDKKDIFSITEIAQELIKEVMDSSFISAKTKEDYCNRLAELNEYEKKAIIQKSKLKAEEKTYSSIMIESRERLVQLVSIMFGLLSAMMTLLMVFTTYLKDKTSEISLLQEKSFILLPTLFSVTALIVAMTFMMFFRQVQRRRKRDREIKPNHTIEISKKEKEDTT